MMSKTTGYVDENGTLRYRIEYDMKRPWDIAQLIEILEDPSAGAIKQSYDDERAVVTVMLEW